MTQEYKWGAMSPNDPSPVPLKYYTREEAERHANIMNNLIDDWDENPYNVWNKGHWQLRPLPWIVKELPW